MYDDDTTYCKDCGSRLDLSTDTEDDLETQTCVMCQDELKDQPYSPLNFNKEN